MRVVYAYPQELSRVYKQAVFSLDAEGVAKDSYMATELIELKNLGKTSVQWLNAVGIRTHDQLQSVGAVNAYCKVRDRGFKVSKVLLYALEGALLDVHWNELDPPYKERLLEQASEMTA